MFSIDESNKLGSGSFATVFSGLYDGLPAAVKKIDLRRHSHSSLKFIDTEIKIQRKLKHKNIVTLFTSKQQDTCIYLVLELMESGDLYNLLYTQDIPLDSLACLTIAQNIVAGLDYLHDQGFLHRDIKPENILFNNRMQAKIADFGLATEKIDAQTSLIIGTKDYLAPQLALSVTLNAKTYEYNELTDCYALGITLLEMICRETPYDKTGEELPWQSIAAGNHREIPRETHPILADIVSNFLAKNPEDQVSLKAITQLLSIFLLDAGTKAGETISPAVNGNFHTIHFAAKMGQINIIKLLIEHNPDLVHVQDDVHQTALLWAASRGHDDIVAFLISQGADVNVATQHAENPRTSKNHHNYSPLDWAIKGNHTGCISILTMAGAIANHMPSMIKDKTLYEVINEGNLTFVQTLLQYNPAFLTQTDEEGYTLLHYATHAGQIMTVRYLIAMGVDVNITTRSLEDIKGIKYPEMTALDIVLNTEEHDAVGILLLENGARIPTAKNGKYHVIHLAAKNGRLDIIKKLIRHKPELVHVKDSFNQTALLWAASRGQDHIVAFLISQGADVNVATQHGAYHEDHNNSPLDWAIKGNHTGCISILMMAGAIANNRIAEYTIELTKNKNLFFNGCKRQKITLATENPTIAHRGAV